MNKHKFIFFNLLLFWTIVCCPNIPVIAQDSTLPTAFLIGEYEHEYESLGLNCNQMLLSVCKDSMDHAYRVWLTMLVEIETFAQKKNFDINGIKIWINVYWNPNGKIKHIAYYPKPSSKNMDFSNLTVFFQDFIDVYQAPITSSQCFAHNGSTSFPSYAELYLQREK